MSNNLLVFDIDDTITKSEFQHQSSFIKAMQHFGIVKINQNWAAYEHMTDSYILRKNFRNNLIQTFDQKFIIKFEEKMMEFMRSHDKVVELLGAKAMIDNVKKNEDFDYCFATGSFLEPALMKLSQASIDHAKEIVIGSNHYFTREEIVQEAINKAKTFYAVKEYNTIISFGDGFWDLKTAKNLNLHFVGVGASKQIQFAEAGVKYCLKDWLEFDFKTLKSIFGIN